MNLQRITTILLIALVGAGAASAQYQGGQGSRAGKGGMRGPPGEERAERETATGLADQARFQLHELEDDLKLDPAQRAAWAAYADRVQKLADDVVRNRNAVRFPEGTAAEQLDSLAELLRNRLTALEDITDAGKALYGVLTPPQKTLADGRLARIAVPLIVPYQPIAESGSRGARPPDASAAPK